jgi:hypothetical protein
MPIDQGIYLFVDLTLFGTDESSHEEKGKGSEGINLNCLYNRGFHDFADPVTFLVGFKRSAIREWQLIPNQFSWSELHLRGRVRSIFLSLKQNAKKIDPGGASTLIGTMGT